jgi:hypothetical protein
MTIILNTAAINIRNRHAITKVVKEKLIFPTYIIKLNRTIPAPILRMLYNKNNFLFILLPPYFENRYIRRIITVFTTALNSIKHEAIMLIVTIVTLKGVKKYIKIRSRMPATALTTL